MRVVSSYPAAIESDCGAIGKVKLVNLNDILLWRDGFWCFREELSPDFLRDDNYREIVFSSDEWLRIISARPFRP